MTTHFAGRAAKTTVLMIFFALFAVFFGFGTRYVMRADHPTVTLSETMSFEGLVKAEQLGFSKNEVVHLNKCGGTWRDFDTVSIELFPKNGNAEIGGETVFYCNVRIRTRSNRNIVMRQKQIHRKNLVHDIVRQVNYAGEEYSLFHSNTAKKISEIKTIHL